MNYTPPTSWPGRFVLLYGEEKYVASWNTWDEAGAALEVFPIRDGYRLIDQDTGRVWFPGAQHDWEAAAT